VYLPAGIKNLSNPVACVDSEQSGGLGHGTQAIFGTS